MKTPSFKQIGKGLFFSVLCFAVVFAVLMVPSVYRKLTIGSWNAPPPVVDPDLCYCGHGILFYDSEKVKPPDKCCPAKKASSQSQGGE
jgi:hypothetical protein